MIKYVKSYDADYHIVFKDSAGRTMIGEIPDPNCVNLNSNFRSGIIHARAQFDAMFTATTTFKTASVPVTITGVGFFDYNEGQEGIAPNGVELHPIIDIIFGPTFSLAPSASAITAVQGNSATVTISTSIANGFNSSLNFLAAGLPTGVTAAFDQATIAAPGLGSTTLTLFADASVPMGTYNVVITASDGGQSRSTTVALTIASADGSTQQLLLNPGFENGTNPTPWTSTSGVIDSSTFQAPRSGLWKAWLNGFGATHTDTLLQQATIPSDATAASLSFWLHIDTAEATTTKANDSLKIQLRNSAGTVLGTLGTYTNLNAAAGYTQRTFDVYSYRGQTVQVYLIGVENSSLKTSFVVDDFSLNITNVPPIKPTLSISVAPSAVSLQQGKSTTASVTSIATGRFNSSVSLTATDVPSGTIAAFDPTVIAAPGSGSSVITLTAGASTPVGTYPITITATGGDLVRTTTLSVTITPSSGGPTTQQLLGNPGFENGSTNTSPWVTTSGVINNHSAFEAPHSGSWTAWLDGYGSAHTDSIYQQVAIPATTTAATLVFWQHIDTAETTTTAAYDTLKLQIRNQSGAVLATLATYSNRDAGAGYSQASFDLSSYKGQTIQLFFVGIEDSSLKTSFVLDDFALNVTTP